MRDFLRYLWKEWFRQVGEALLVALIVTTYLFTTVQVVGMSMYPTLNSGERVLVPKYRMWLVRLGLDRWHRGEIAIIKPPPGAPNSVAPFPVLGFKFRPYFIKRIVALPGDRVRVERGQLFVNDAPVAETHITSKITPYPDSFPVVRVYRGRVIELAVFGSFVPVDRVPDYLRPVLAMLEPPPPEVVRQSQELPVAYVANLRLAPDYYFVLGDNRTLGGSEDSRIFGPLRGERIAGNASFVWWPPLARGGDGRWRLNLRPLPIPPGFRQVPPPSRTP